MLEKTAESYFLLHVEQAAQLSSLHPLMPYFSLGRVSLGTALGSVSPVHQAGMCLGPQQLGMSICAQALWWPGPQGDGSVVALASLVFCSASHIHHSCLG